MVAVYNPSWRGIAEALRLAVIAAGGVPSMNPYPANFGGVIRAIDDLRATLVSVSPTQALAAHVAQADPHAQYVLDNDTRLNETKNMLDLLEQGAVAAPAADVARLYAVDVQGITALEYQSATGFTARVLRDQLVIVRNTSGADLLKGAVVYATGVTAGDVPTVSPARANAANTMIAIGILAQDIANNAFGRAMSQGKITGISTTGFTVGQPLYVSAAVAGGLTNVRPLTPNLVQIVGSVLSVGNNGALSVNLGDLQDVNSDAHIAATAAVHGLPADAHVLGSKMGAGRFAQSGSATANSNAVGQSFSQFRDVAVVFPVPFATVPRVFITCTTGYPSAVTNITVNGFTARVFGELNFAATNVINYLAVGT